MTEPWLDQVMATNAEHQRAFRARNGANVGGPRGPAPSAPCGTVSAYKRHQRRKEPIDDACRAAWSEYQRERYEARRGG